MSETLDERLHDVRVEAEVAKTQAEGVRVIQLDHEQRIRDLERDTTNNSLVIKAAMIISGTLLTTALSVAVLLIKVALGES